MFYEPNIDPEIDECFRVCEEIKFPVSQYQQSPKKSLKERLLEQENERIKEIKAFEKRFSENEYVPEDVFMCRSDMNSAVQHSEFSTNLVKSNIFREDVDSYHREIPKQKSARLIRPVLLSNFERLHSQRDTVTWSESVRLDFEIKKKILERFMDNRNLSEVGNDTKRIAKEERVNLKLPRYTAQMVNKRVQEGVADLFGHFSLVPVDLVPLTKSNKSVIAKKRMLIDRFSHLIIDFDYTKRSGYQENLEYMEMNNKIRQLNEFLCNPTLPHPLYPGLHLDSSSTISVGDKEKITLKRKMRDCVELGEIVPKKIEKYQQMARIEISKEKMYAQNENARKDLERRREAVRQRELEREEKRRREQEEIIKRRNAEMKEKAIREKERHRIEEELRKIEEQERLVKICVEQERLKIIEADTQRAKAKKDAEELERIKGEISKAEGALKSLTVQNDLSTTDINAAQLSIWNFKACKKPENWKQRKDKLFNHYRWPLDPSQREVEKGKIISKPREKLIIIPKENNASTRIISLHRPAKVKQENEAPVVKLSAVSSAGIHRALIQPTPARVSADAMLTEKLVKELKELMMLNRKSLAVRISLVDSEVDYGSINLQTLKSNIGCPFKISDGLYWPIFYALHNRETFYHVEALTTCNTFSGKYASHHLLTTSNKEDDCAKDFEGKFAVCDGDWYEYSQKPGRFSNRIGFTAKSNNCKDSFEIQKQRARVQMRRQFQHETDNDAEFRKYVDEHEQRPDPAQFQQRLNTHLRTLVRDSRLDLYSSRETFNNIDGVSCHPGTRVSPYELYWCSHGYRIYLPTRDEEYCEFMEKVCHQYENLLPKRNEHDKFNEWVFAPLLASLFYQANYKQLDAFSESDMNALNERYKKYLALVQKEKKFSLRQARELCRLTETDKKQWTICHDQLVAHFKDFPSISNMVYDNNCKLIPRIDQVIEVLMNEKFKSRENGFLDLMHL